MEYTKSVDKKWQKLWDSQGIFNVKIKDTKSLGQKHEVEYNLELVRSIGADTDDLHISLPTKEKDTQHVDNLLFHAGIKQTDLITRHPESISTLTAVRWGG